MNTIPDLIGKIKAIKSEKGFHTFFAEITNIFRYQWANMIVFEASPTKRISSFVFTGMPEDVKSLMLGSDIIRQYCFKESAPISYQDLLLKNNEKLTHKQDSLLIPINGFGNEIACLVLAVPKLATPPEALEKLGWYWLILSPLIYDKYHKLFTAYHNMSKRELECMKWAAEGKTSWEISQLLYISQRTVDFHLANCVTKTGSVNRQQAIVKCALNGQLLTN